MARAADNKPVRVGLIGAGKFGSMFLSQVPTSKGLHVSVIADINVDAAKHRCRAIGWTEERIRSTRFMENAFALIEEAEIDVVVEATGNPVIGVAHANAAIEAGIKQVRFDRGPVRYLGRVAALADAAREVGLKF